MAYSNVSVASTATLIIAANPARRSLTIVNNADDDIFIGSDDSITTANAIPLYSNQTRDQDQIAEGWKGPVYGIVASGTADVRYWEITTG